MLRFMRARAILLAIAGLVIPGGLLGVLPPIADLIATTSTSSPATSASATALAAEAKSDGAVVSWKPSTAPVLGYSLYRRAGTAAPVLVNPEPTTATKLFDAGLKAGTTYTYSVAAVTLAKTTTAMPGSVSVTARDPLAPYASTIAKECPAPTTRVSTAAQLRTALAGARAGQVIWLEPGVYSGTFKLERSGTSTGRIWICGSPQAVIDAGSIAKGQALSLDRASHVGLSGFTVRNALQGVMIKHSSNVIVARLTVTDIGYEGIHVYAFSSAAVIRDNVISNTGSLDVAYGEGVYVGTSDRRWDVVTGGAPDTTNRVLVLRNKITNAGAEPIEAKPGTSDGVIQQNLIVGHQAGSRAIGWVLVSGNSWIIRGNEGTGAVTNAYALMRYGTTWGVDNAVTGNSGTAASSGWGVLVHHPGSPIPAGTVVGCDNAVSGAASGATHVTCQN